MARPVAILCLLWLTVVAYLPTSTAGYVYEDHDPTTGDLVQPGRGSLLAPRAITNLTVAIQARLGSTPRAYHAVNLGLHLTNGLLVIALVTPLGESAALLAGLGFLLHPLNGEAVRYVSARTDLLMVTALLVTLGLTTRPTWPRVLGVTLAGLLVVGAKESGVVVLGLVPLWLWYRRQWSRRWLVPLSVWAVGGAWAAYRLLHVSAGEGAAPWSAIQQYTAPAAHSWLGFVGVQLVAVTRLVALLVPVGLSIDHDFDVVPPVLGLVALVAWLGVAVWLWRWRTARFALGWLAVALSVRVVIPQPEYVHEQHLYGALLGLWIALGVAGAQLSAPRSLAGWRERMADG
jgi:hypothetical protein